MMAADKKRPPFRADHVGSLLRPAELRQARIRRERGETDADALRIIEDRLISDVVAKQQAVGLQTITDGEFRRGSWNFDFLGQIGGRGSNRYATSRAGKQWCLVWLQQKCLRWKARTCSNAGSMRRQNLSPLASCAYRRNAVLQARITATF